MLSKYNLCGPPLYSPLTISIQGFKVPPPSAWEEEGKGMPVTFQDFYLEQPLSLSLWGFSPGSFVLYFRAYSSSLLCYICFYGGGWGRVALFTSSHHHGNLVFWYRHETILKEKEVPYFSTLACRCMGIKILAQHSIAGSNVKAKKQVLLIFLITIEQPQHAINWAEHSHN